MQGMAFTPEPPEVRSEDEFREKIIEEIRSILKSRGVIHEILTSFGLDIAVFIDADRETECRFIEVKTASMAKGRIGFGNSSGEGTQVDLLILNDDSVRRLDSIISWVLGDYTKAFGERRFAFFDCTAAKSGAMNGVARGKQNNLNGNMLMRNAISWEGLSKELEAFLVGTP